MDPSCGRLCAGPPETPTSPFPDVRKVEQAKTGPEASGLKQSPCRAQSRSAELQPALRSMSMTTGDGSAKFWGGLLDSIIVGVPYPCSSVPFYLPAIMEIFSHQQMESYLDCVKNLYGMSLFSYSPIHLTSLLFKGI